MAITALEKKVINNAPDHRVTYIIDTNVLLNESGIVGTLNDAEIIIPQTVLAELDKVKTSRADADLRFRAREVSRQLYQYTEIGKLSDGIKLENNSTLKVLVPEPSGEVPTAIKSKSADDQILSLAYHLKNQLNKKVILITSDMNMLVKAQAIGLDAVRHEGKESKKIFSILKSKRWQNRLIGIFAVLLLIFLTLPTLSNFIDNYNKPQTPLQIFHQKQQAYLDTLKNDPSSFEANAGLANLYFGVKMWNEAVKYNIQALRIKPNSWDNRIDLGVSLFNVGNREEGINELRRVIASNPNLPMAHFNLAAMLAQLGRADFYKVAISEYLEYIKLEPNGKYVSEAKTNIIRLRALINKGTVKS